MPDILFYPVYMVLHCEHLRAILRAIAGMAGKLVPPARSACCPGNHSDDPHSLFGAALGRCHSHAHHRAGKIFLRMAVPIWLHAPFRRLSRLARTLRQRKNRCEPIHGQPEDKILHPSGPAFPGSRLITGKHRGFFRTGTRSALPGSCAFWQLPRQFREEPIL